MESGALVEWSKEEGDAVGPGDVLAIIKTDKTNVDFEMQEDGFLAKKLVPESDDDVSLGAPVAVIVEDENDVAAFKDFTAADADDGESVAAPAPAPTPAPAPASAPAPAASPAAASSPAPAPAAPAPAPTPSPAAGTGGGGTGGGPSTSPASQALAGASGFASVPFEGFGLRSKKSSIGGFLQASQDSYSDTFGDTGFESQPENDDADAARA